MNTADRLAYLARQRRDATKRLLGDMIVIPNGAAVLIEDVLDLDDDLRYATVRGDDGREWEIDETGAASTDGAVGVCGALSRDPAFDPRN